VNVLSNLREKLDQSKRYRESWAASIVKRMLPLQIRVLRREREWSQADLAKKAELTQGVISRAENPNYGNLSVNTLVRIAAGFDCAFIGRFVPFSELGKWYTSVTEDKALEVPSFPHDRGFEALPTVAPGELANCTYWQSAYLANSAPTEVFYVPRKEPGTATVTTPHRPQEWQTITDVRYPHSEFAAVQ
jgi:transcriptional regulator with XRE-family HTH domain